MKKVLIVAGSDSGGGAGIQADIKTATANQVYSSSVITCLTAQNTKKVFSIHNPPVKFLEQQMQAVLQDINFDAVKIGMLGEKKIIKSIHNILENHKRKIKIVLDTVMVATSGDVLLKNDAIGELKKFIKIAHICTPNIDEAEILINSKITNLEEMKNACIKIKKLGCKSVLIKGGHLKFRDKKIYDVLIDEKNKFHIFVHDRIGKDEIHGTGCTLSSAIACNLAKGFSLVKSIKMANVYMKKAILSSKKIGKGSLILRHFIDE